MIWVGSVKSDVCAIITSPNNELSRAYNDNALSISAVVKHDNGPSC